MHFTFDPSLTKKFIEFGYQHYQGDTSWIPPLRKTLYHQFSPAYPFYQKSGNRHRHFLATANGNVIGRISAIVNGDLRDKNGTPVGTFGFFECIDDNNVAHDLISSAIQWLHETKGINRIWGPMNFDIWHNYRLMTKGFDQKLFYGEPYNKPYYPHFFEACNFEAKYEWDSIEIVGREALESMITRGKKRYELLLDRGYRFELFNMGKFEEELRKLHHIICESYAEFLGFTPIPFKEFALLSTGSRHALHPGLSAFVYNENNVLAGFATSFYEVSDAIRFMNGKTNIISKLRFMRHRKQVDRINFYIGGVIPEEITRRSGLGRAGFYFVINQMLKEGYEKLLLTLRLKGNLAHALLWKNKTEPQREYVLYELNL
jgi:hypothetical protein